MTDDDIRATREEFSHWHIRANPDYCAAASAVDALADEALARGNRVAALEAVIRRVLDQQDGYSEGLAWNPYRLMLAAAVMPLGPQRG